MMRSWPEFERSELAPYSGMWRSTIDSFAGRIAAELTTAVLAGNIEVLWERSDLASGASRAAIQFKVSPELFDEFFNSPAGYRGMFRQDTYVGTCSNAVIIDVISGALANLLPEKFNAHDIGGEFVPSGRVSIEKTVFLRSLEPWLAKIWMCTVAILANGERRSLSLGVGHERIDVGLQHNWPAVCREPEDCILEVKGAFVASFGLFQSKSISERGKSIGISGAT